VRNEVSKIASKSSAHLQMALLLKGGEVNSPLKDGGAHGERRKWRSWFK
jgi:hypothetical protein